MNYKEYVENKFFDAVNIGKEDKTTLFEKCVFKNCTFSKCTKVFEGKEYSHVKTAFISCVFINCVFEDFNVRNRDGDGYAYNEGNLYIGCKIKDYYVGSTLYRYSMAYSHGYNEFVGCEDHPVEYYERNGGGLVTVSIEKHNSRHERYDEIIEKLRSRYSRHVHGWFEIDNFSDPHNPIPEQIIQEWVK